MGIDNLSFLKLFFNQIVKSYNNKINFKQSNQTFNYQDEFSTKIMNLQQTKKLNFYKTCNN